MNMWLFCKHLINYRIYVYQPYYEVLLKECSEFKTSLTAAFVTSCWLPQKAILLMHCEEARNENSFKEVHLENWYILNDGRRFFIDFCIMGCWRKEEQENQDASVRVLRSTQRDLMKQKCAIIHFYQSFCTEIMCTKVKKFQPLYTLGRMPKHII